MKTTHVATAVRPFLVVALLAVALLYLPLVAYCYCLVRQPSWSDARSEADLDRRMLVFYTKRAISPSEASDLAREYVLRPGERMVRYLVLASMPVDVVLDSTSRVVQIFDSYE